MRVFQAELCVSAIYKAMTSASANSSLPDEDRKPTVLYHTAASLHEFSYCLYICCNTSAKQHATHKLSIYPIIFTSKIKGQINV